MPPRIEKLSVKNLRSVGDETVTIRFPESVALVLLEVDLALVSRLEFESGSVAMRYEPTR